MKVTQWFPASVNPVRKGTYEVRNSMNKIRFSAYDFRRYFDGRNWLFRKGGGGSNVGLLPSDQWRGLAEKPKS